jgi:hypothetical protein
MAGSRNSSPDYSPPIVLTRDEIKLIHIEKAAGKTNRELCEELGRDLSDEILDALTEDKLRSLLAKGAVGVGELVYVPYNLKTRNK